MTEHLYRDDVGAAVERLEQLKAENARLRDELARLRGRSAAPPRPWVILGAALALLTGMSFVSVIVCAQQTCRGRGHARHARMPVPEFSPISDADDCSLGYAYDSNGVRREKPGCQGRVHRGDVGPLH